MCLLTFIILLLVPFFSHSGRFHFSKPNLWSVFSFTDSFFVISLPVNTAFSFPQFLCQTQFYVAWNQGLVAFVPLEALIQPIFPMASKDFGQQGLYFSG